MSKDLSGSRFGRLSVVGKDIAMSLEKRRTYWYCVCDCGKLCLRKTQVLLVSGESSSCGCFRKKHEYEGTRTYNTWQSAIQRCTNKNLPNYERYGGAGVTVCSRWMEDSPKGFLNFLEDMGERPENTSLNRVRGAKVYSKDTCEWATAGMQAFDRKTRVTNKSGVSGVMWDERYGKWKVSIGYQNKKLHLGYISDLDDAIKVRRSAELKYYGFITGGETK